MGWVVQATTAWGWTGRAGATGIAVSFCNGDDEPEFLRDIQKLIGADPVFAALSGAFDSVRTRTEYA